MGARILTSFSTAALAFAMAISPAMAKDEPAEAEKPKAPVTSKEITAVDVAATPVTDLNLRKDEIPQLLLDAQASPYSVSGLSRCPQIAAKVGEFDAVLGDDIDLPQTEGRRVSGGRVAQWVVGSFIPFRGLIREVSGANGQQLRFQAAIQAGVARRSFLKGLGEAKGCRYPARSATREIWDQKVAEQKAAEEAKDSDKDAKVADAR